MPSARKGKQQAQRKTKTKEIVPQTRGLALLDLPFEILSQIFEYLLVLPKENHFRDPGTSPHPIYKTTPTLKIPRGLYYPHFPPAPTELDTSILRVCKALTPVAEHVLYAQNMFVFRSADAIKAFAKKVNRPRSKGLIPRTASVRRMQLHCKDMQYEWDGRFRFDDRFYVECLRQVYWTDARFEGYEWDRYFDSGRLIKDFPGLSRLETHFPVAVSTWLWEGTPVHPAMVDCNPLEIDSGEGVDTKPKF